MKNLIMILFLVTGTLISCSEDKTGNVSTRTDFPTFTMEGDELMFINQGDPFVDPGVTATEDGEELPVTTLAVGTYMQREGADINTDVGDIYELFYSAENSDGFSGSVVRTVWVVPPSGDLVSSISGLYSSDVQRAPSFTPGPPYEDMIYVWITKTGDNTYQMSDGVGGYYDLGRGFGTGYASKGGVITANDIPGNDFSVSQAVFPIWGNTVDVTDMKVDPASKSITFTGNGNFGNGEFRVQLYQVEL